MVKAVTAIIVVSLFCLLYTVAIVAQDRRPGPANGNAAFAKAEVGKLGFGKRVNVKLTNGNKASGRITGYAHDHFVVTDSNGRASAIAYADVFKVSTQKEKLGIFDRAWTGIMFTAAGVGTVIVATLGWLD